jgi:hypothetical protein
MQGFSKNLVLGQKQVEFVFLPTSTPQGLSYTVFSADENSAFKVYNNGAAGWHVNLSELPEWVQEHEHFFIKTVADAQSN